MCNSTSPKMDRCYYNNLNNLIITADQINIITNGLYSSARKVMVLVFLSGLSVCLSVRLINQKVTMYMTFIPEVRLEPRINRLDFGDDPDYNPDPVSGFTIRSDPGHKDSHEHFTRGASRDKNNPLHFWDESSELRSRIRITIIIFGGGFHSD